MKIGIIQSVIGAGGGNDKVLFSLLNKLKETDHKVTLYTVGNPMCNLDNFEIKSVKKVFPIKIPVFGIYQKMLEPILAKKGQHEDVLVALTGDLFLPYNKKQKLIFYSQNNYADPSKSDTSKYKKGAWKLYYMPYKKMMSKFMNNLKNYNIDFIANSEYVKDQLKDGINADAKVIYPPVELDKFPDENWKREGIISVGRFSKEKNFDKIIDLVGDFNIPKRLFGSVSEANRNYYSNLIKKGKPKKFTFYTNQHYDLMLKLLHKSKVFISASDETFGIAVVEAISAGCIPIVPNKTAHKETVPIDDLRYDLNNDEDAKQKIISALENPKYDEHKKTLQKHIQKYDVSEFQKNFLGVIENGV